MREDFWEFDPTHKIWLATNHKPEVKGTDHGIWRRLRLIPFDGPFWDPRQGRDGAGELQADKTLAGQAGARRPPASSRGWSAAAWTGKPAGCGAGGGARRHDGVPRRAGPGRDVRPRSMPWWGRATASRPPSSTWLSRGGMNSAGSATARCRRRSLARRSRSRATGGRPATAPGISAWRRSRRPWRRRYLRPRPPP